MARQDTLQQTSGTEFSGRWWGTLFPLRAYQFLARETRLFEASPLERPESKGGNR